MATRILHFADVHLDAPFKWAAREVARKRRQGLRDALSRIMDLAIAERVDALTCGGDLYEQDYFTPDTAEFLRIAFDRIAPIPVFISPGNHDWSGPLSLYRRVRWGSHVRIFEDRRLTPIEFRRGVTLWGAAHQAPAGTSGFLDGFHVAGDGVHLALFHGSELGSLAFQEEGKTTHAPFRADEIPASGLSYALVGHYHTPVDRSHFSYPGNPDPLTFGESGDRGALLVTVANEGSISIERHRVAVSAVHDIVVDVTGCSTLQQIRDAVAGDLRGLGGCVRLIVRGEVAPDVDLPREAFSASDFGLDAIELRLEVTVAYDLDGIGKEPTVRGQFVRDVRQAQDLSETDRRPIIVTGLRALEGRSDLDVC
jgi:DNA repair exonuclease SbcCD nuclease subunit